MGRDFMAKREKKEESCRCCARCCEFQEFCCACFFGPVCFITPLPPKGHLQDRDQELSNFYLTRRKFGFPRDDGTCHSSLWHFMKNNDQYLSMFFCDDEHPVQSLPRLSMYITLVLWRIVFSVAFAPLGDSMSALFARAICTTLVVTVIDTMQEELATCSYARRFCPEWAARFEDIALRALALFLSGGAFVILLTGFITAATPGRKVAVLLKGSFWTSFIISEIMNYVFPLVTNLCNFYVFATWKTGYLGVFPSIRGLESSYSTIWRHTGPIAYGIGSSCWLEDKLEIEAELAKSEVEDGGAAVKYSWLKLKQGKAPSHSAQVEAVVIPSDQPLHGVVVGISP